MPYFELTNCHMKISTIIFSLTIAICFFSQAKAQSNRPRARIDHVALFVVDLQKEQAFYRDIIQLDSLAEPFHDQKQA
jgi:lactoylglutathione lyase